MEERRNLYFGSGRNYKLLARNITFSEAMKTIHRNMENYERPSSYIRTWDEDGIRWVDYGSWSTFYAWSDVTNFVAMLRLEELK